ncbi:MAG: DNA-directed RNA polymerase subunit omega [Spirochaetales bacterium]|nr:DNA-directed RNA polymerase subunit omega [Spirochaetales bacterium]
MAISLEKIVDFNGNIYEVTNAVIRRARQITEIGDEDLEQHGFKVVSTSLEQIFTRKIEYQLED